MKIRPLDIGLAASSDLLEGEAGISIFAVDLGAAGMEYDPYNKTVAPTGSKPKLRGAVVPYMSVTPHYDEIERQIREIVDGEG